MNSLRWKIILSLIFVYTAMVALASYTFYRLDKALVTNVSNEYYNSLTKTIEGLIKAEIKKGIDIKTVADHLPGGVHLFNSEGMALKKNDESVELTLLMAADKEGQVFRPGIPGDIVFLRRIDLSNNKIFLGIDAQKSGIIELLHGTGRAWLIILLLGGAGFILSMIFLVEMIVLLPLRRFKEWVDRISREGLDSKGEIQDSGITTEEFLSLSNSFREMVYKLKKQDRALKDKIEEFRRINVDLKTTKDHLIRSEKLASIGKLSAGIAHEIGNPLGAVIGYMELLSRSRNLDNEERAFVANSLKELKRIKNIIKELLAFARGGVYQGKMESLDLKEVLKQTIALVSHQKIFKEIEIEAHFSETPAILGDREKLRQLFLNLMLNGAQAQNGRGKLRIELFTIRWSDIKDGYKHRPEKVIPPFRQDIKLAVAVSIKDWGPGIEEKDINRIFDPFFSTKDVGEGTGLGLTVAQQIAENHGGMITVSSKPAKGSTFYVFFPAKQ